MKIQDAFWYTIRILITHKNRRDIFYTIWAYKAELYSWIAKPSVVLRAFGCEISYKNIDYMDETIIHELRNQPEILLEILRKDIFWGCFFRKEFIHRVKWLRSRIFNPWLAGFGSEFYCGENSGLKVGLEAG